MRLSTVELVILGLSTILQLVCLVAPGWWIQTFKYRYDGSTMYGALFYLITCKDSHCETVSWLTFWEKDDAVVIQYDNNIRQQTFLIVAMVATVVCFALHAVKLRKQTVSVQIIVKTTCSCMVGSGALMIWNLSDYYIRIRYIYSIEDQIDVGDIYGFPYCVLLYSIAFLANVIVFILCVGDVREHRRQTSQDIPSEQAGLTTTKTVVWSPSHYTVP